MLGRYCVLSVLLISNPVLAAKQIRHPTNPWNVEYAASQCVASRDYGTTDKPLYLVLKPSPLGGVMRMAIVQKGRAPLAQTAGKVQFDDRSAIDTGMLTYTDDKHGNWAASTNIRAAEFSANRAARSVRIWGSSLSETFVVSKLPEVSQELQKCLVSLHTKWNVEAADRAARVARDAKPRQPIQTYFSGRVYPWDALRNRQSGAVKVVLLIDEKGEVSDCSVEETSGVPSLDATSCYVLQARAQFEPAVGPDGKTVRTIYCTRVGWLLAGGTLPRATQPADPRCPPKH